MTEQSKSRTGLNRIAIMAPTRDLEMTRYQCAAGADEVYVGLDSRVINDSFDNFSFNGRYNKINGVQCQTQDVEELEKVVKYAQARKVQVNYTANIHYLSSKFAEDFDRYIDIGLELGVDALIVSNFGLIQRIRKRKISTPILAGVFLVTPNVEQTKILRDMGVDRVVLPQGATLKEIIAFKEKTDMQVEIFGHFGGGNNCGRCMLLHSPTISDIGPGCRATYDVYYDGKKQAQDSYYMDAAADCSLCSLPDLMKTNVDVIKIVGRESNNALVNSIVTEFYAKFQDYYLEGMSINEIKQRFDEDEIMWSNTWLPRHCDRDRCRFRPTDITRSYVV